MSINKYIDHTLLKAEATNEDIIKLCLEAKNYNFKTVCVNPNYVALASELLKDSDVGVCTVIGFPLGANESAVKGYEASYAVRNGADEVDMVINIGQLKSGNYEFVKNDIEAVVRSVDKKAKVKVILETCLLSDDEIVKACEAAMAAGADFVKTSTGFSTGGATEKAVSLMKKTVGNRLEVKASGGIRNYEDAMKMIKAGATRIGASAGVKIVEEEKVK